MSRMMPRPSQVESNPTRASYLMLQEDLVDALDTATEVEDIADVMSDASSEFESIVEELRDKATNIEDGFGHETMMSSEFNERADEVEAWAENLTSLEIPDDPRDEEPQPPKREDYLSDEDGDDQFESASIRYQDEHSEWQESVDNWEDTIQEVREQAQDLVAEAPEI